MNFLFWNVQKKSLDGLVVRLVQDHKVSVLVLVEHPRSQTPLLGVLKDIGNFRRLKSHDRFGIYVRFSANCMTRLFLPVENDRIDCWQLHRGPSYSPVILMVVHGLDIRNHPEGHRTLFFERVTESIHWIESKVGHNRTIVLGDLNANPFEAPISSVRGLHAIPVSEVNTREDRTVCRKNYKFFYNPMWRCYGSRKNSPLATYYHYSYKENELFWHMIDQVVLRPSVLPFFAPEQLQILDRAGFLSLTNDRGTPDDKNASDHLPVLFQLNLRR